MKYQACKSVYFELLKRLNGSPRIHTELTRWSKRPKRKEGKYAVEG